MCACVLHLNFVELAILLKMLYLFEVLGTDFIKFGWTKHANPWMRIQNGFWTNSHPIELCGKLAPENLNLVHVFDGGLKEEQIIQSIFPSYEFEFWKRTDLEKIVTFMRMMLEEKPLPVTRPIFQENVSNERLPCCGGIEHKCKICGKTFKRPHKLWEHQRDIHQRIKFKCKCGVEVCKKHLSRHLKTKRHLEHQ